MSPYLPPLPPLPKPPVPSEAAAIDYVVSDLARLRHVIDAVVADLNGAVTSTVWLGADADAFRSAWYTQRGQLEALRFQTQQLIGTLQGRSAAESVRFRAQSQAVAAAMRNQGRK
jgi:membrane protein YqaA with SNARE-associated domain